MARHEPITNQIPYKGESNTHMATLKEQIDKAVKSYEKAQGAKSASDKVAATIRATVEAATIARKVNGQKSSK